MWAARVLHPMLLPRWVEVPARGGEVRGLTGSDLMDMESMPSLWESLHLYLDTDPTVDGRELDASDTFSTLVDEFCISSLNLIVLLDRGTLITHGTCSEAERQGECYYGHSTIRENPHLFTP